jgi:phage gpG-like protein
MRLDVDMRAEAVLARLSGGPERLKAGITRAVTRLAIVVQAGVKGDRLSGQVLHVRTGTLRRSINQRVTVTDDAVMASVGTNVRYAAAHEHGFNGTVTIPAHTRRSALQMLAKRSKRVRKSEGEIQVRSYTRQMVIPQRSFLGSELAARADEIRQTLREAALEAVRL